MDWECPSLFRPQNNWTWTWFIQALWRFITKITILPSSNKRSLVSICDPMRMGFSCPHVYSVFCSQTPRYFPDSAAFLLFCCTCTAVTNTQPASSWQCIRKLQSLPIIQFQRYFHIVRYFYGNSFLPIATFLVCLGCSNKNILNQVAYKQKFSCQRSGCYNVVDSP